MVDFRIPLPDGGPPHNLARELDWDRELGIWTVSQREYGSSSWRPAANTSAYDLGQILVFFRLLEPVRESILVRLSPGECALIHASQMGTHDLVADLCGQCAEHWLVYRREENRGWRLYGRTCNFVWHRGTPREPESDETLAALIHGSTLT